MVPHGTFKLVKIAFGAAEEEKRRNRTMKGYYANFLCKTDSPNDDDMNPSNPNSTCVCCNMYLVASRLERATSSFLVFQ